MNEAVDLTITIVSFNSKDVTRQALGSIYQHTRDLSFEIIVVDNASFDGSADMIEQEFPSVQLIRSSRNLGFGAAHNVAIQQARGKYILVLNSDVLFLDNAVKRMVETFRSWPNKVGALGPKILYRDGSYAPSASYRQFPPRFLVGIAMINLIFPFVHYVPLVLMRNKFGIVLSKVHGKFLQPSVVERVEWVDGICVLFSRDALERVGLFDEQYFFDMEIGDLQYRIREQGWEIIFDPETAIVHLGGYSRHLNPSILRQSIKSILVYYAKFRPDYVPFIKFVLGNSLRIKANFLKRTNESGEQARLYRQMRSDLRDFVVSSAYANESIPDLVKGH
ncbi:MAG: hypothetical protein AMXMBFR16_11930 [Candidatus Uhrbacteria bacterium]